MNYLIQEIEALQTQVKGHERINADLIERVLDRDVLINNLHADLCDARFERDEAKDLLADLQREIVPT